MSGLDTSRSIGLSSKNSTAVSVGCNMSVSVEFSQNAFEEDIAAAPKILAVFLVLMILGVGYIKLLTNLLQEGFALAFNQIPASDSYVLPANYHRYTVPFAEEMKESRFQKQEIGDIMRNPGKIPFIDNNEKIKYHPSDRMPNPSPNFIERKRIMER